MTKSASIAAMVFICMTAAVPSIAGSNDSSQNITYKIDDAHGRSLRSILSELELKGGPKAHFDAGFGDEILQGSFIANDWSDLLRQLLANHNYYTLSDSNNGRLKDVTILGNGTKNAQANVLPVAVAASEPAPAQCDESQPATSPFGQVGPFADMRKRACEGR